MKLEPTPWSLSNSLRGPLTLGDCAVLMLAVSDNAATNAILDRLGLEAVNDEIERLGLQRTAVRRRMVSDGPENVTCARDLAHGMAAAVADEGRILQALSLAQDSLLPSLVDPGVDVAVKTGELDSVYHEVAWLAGDGRSLVVAVCTEPAERPDRVAEVAAALWHP